MEKLVRTTLRLPPELLHKLRIRAAEQDKSLNAVLLEAAEQWLKRQEKKEK